MEPRKRGPHLIRYKSADHQLEPSLITKRCLTSNKSAPPALPDSLPPKLTDPPMLEEPQDQSLPSPPTAKLSAADKFAVLRFLLERQKQRESLMVLESKSDESEKADDSGVMVTSIDFQDVEEIQTGSDHNGLIGSLSCPNGFSPADNCPAEPDVFTEFQMPTKLTVRKTSFLKKQSWRERRRQQLSKTSSGYGSFSDSDSDEVSSSPTANHSDSSIDEGVVAKSVKGRRSDSGISNTSELGDEEPTGRQSKVLLLTKKFSGLDTDQRRMDLAKIQSITDPYELDLMLDEVNDFDTRKAIRKRMAELKEPEELSSDPKVSLEGPKAPLNMDRAAHLPKRSPSAPSSVARMIAANLVCWSLLCFVMRRGSRNKSAQLVPLVPAPTGTSDKSPKATQDSIGDIQTELSTTGTQVPNDKLAALNGSQAVEGSPQAVPKTQGVALSNAKVTVTNNTTTTTMESTQQKAVAFCAVTPRTFQPGSFKGPSTQQQPESQLPTSVKPPTFAINRSASSIKEALIRWCQSKTKEYENVSITNLSSSWANGLAFCALIHHFHPDAFDYSKLSPNNRADNFDLAFRVAEEYGDIAPLLETEDMLKMGDKPDSKCVFTYVQSFYRRYRETP